MNKFVDLVICGPDMSGTSTQINDVIDYCKSKGLVVRDIRKTETDVLFHAQMFKEYNQNHVSLDDFLKDENIEESIKSKLLLEIHSLLSGYNKNKDLLVGSFYENDFSTYIDPNSADVWILEEPTKRGAGQVNRAIEQNRSIYESKLDPYSAALTHQVYRIDEFLRFRKMLRKLNKIIVRSRSEESACYQIYDENSLQTGIKLDDYLNLPGHKIAFSNPPTHIFVVCGREDWKDEDYIELKQERSSGRDVLDDHELNVGYQILVNYRYSSNWINELYEKGCSLYNSQVPEITKYSIYDSKEEIKEKMSQKLDEIFK